MPRAAGERGAADGGVDAPATTTWRRPDEYPVPAARTGEVTRTRLLNDLRGPESLVVCHAPAGYGKTTLAAQWCRLDERPTAWLRLRPTDNDPVLLLLRLAAALGSVENLDPEYEQALQSFRPSLERAIDRLLDRLQRHRPLQLALDQADQLTEPASLAVLGAVVPAVPAGSQLVVTSRGEVGVPLARFHVSGDLRELQAADLAFTVDETSDLFRHNGVDISERDASTLQSETEGWPAAIGLSLMSARSVGGQIRTSLLLPRRQIGDYLMEEVLDQEPPEIRTFLIRTSILESLTAPLCDAVTGRSDSGQILSDLEGRNLFVAPTGGGDGWYRLHHLWRSFLRSQLSGSGCRADELYRRAAAWHEAHGDPGSSFRLACKGGDTAMAGRVLLRHYDAYASRGLISSLLQWLAECSDRDIEGDPQLAIAAGWITMLSGDFPRATRYLAAAEHHELERPSADGASSLRMALINFRAALGLGGAEQMLADGLAVIESERRHRTRWLVGGYRGSARRISSSATRSAPSPPSGRCCPSPRAGQNCGIPASSAAAAWRSPTPIWASGSTRSATSRWARRRASRSREDRSPSLSSSREPRSRLICDLGRRALRRCRPPSTAPRSPWRHRGWRQR